MGFRVAASPSPPAMAGSEEAVEVGARTNRVESRKTEKVGDGYTYGMCYGAWANIRAVVGLAQALVASGKVLIKLVEIPIRRLLRQNVGLPHRAAQRATNLGRPTYT